MKTESYEERNRGIISKEEQKEEHEELRRGPWTLEEDNLLIHYVACHGEGRWNLLAKSAGLKRTGKSCRLRWLNYLKPDIKRGNLTPQEQLLILELHSKLGNRWSKIAAHLPGRTDNEIKNYWRTRVQKQARQLNMESNSPSFIDAIRCFYMPRLVQKIEQTTTATTAVANHSEIEASSSNSADTSPSQMVNSPNNYNNKMGDIVNFDNTTKHTSCSTVSPSNVSEFPNLPSSQNSKVSSLSLDDCYYVNSSCYDMGLPAMSASDISVSECHVAGHNWPGNDDMAQDAGVWDLDQLW